MTDEVNETSHREILKSSSIIAVSSTLNVLIGLVRIKFLAMTLGPAGVGLVGLLQNLMATASTISAFGMNNVGTRQIAQASSSGSQEELDVARRALFWGTLILATLGAGLFWIFRSAIAEFALNDIALSDEVGYLGIGVFLTVVFGSQRALLNGLRRISDIARVTVYSAALSTVLGIFILHYFGVKGIAFFVISTPFSVFLISFFYTSKLPPAQTIRSSFSSIADSWKVMLRLGASFMIGSLVATFGQLIVRSMIQRELGAESLGYFQASWIISATYLGFVLSAMGTDYYPRLTAVIANKQSACRLVNEQSEVCILLAGPVLTLMLAFTPWIIALLYSDEFSPSIAILRWQTMGDVLKIVSWPLGFVLLASGSGRAVLLLEGLAMTVFVSLSWALLSEFGVVIAGFAYFCMYLTHLGVGFWLVRRIIDLTWYRSVSISFGLLVLSASIVSLLSSMNAILGAAVGGTFAVVWSIFGFLRLAAMADLQGRPGKLAKIARAKLKKIKIFSK